MSKSIGYLYINGLGDGRTRLKDGVVKWWWNRAGLEVHHAHINWYDGVSLAEKLDTIEQQVTAMLKTFGGVAIIGSSAGGSLAINVFHRLSNENTCAISAHGRLAAGNYSEGHIMSLHRRAHMGTSHPSQAFFDSVMLAETETIPTLTAREKERILVLTQLTDLVVPLGTMAVQGARHHQSMALGHSGGFIAHLLVDRDIIAEFAADVLL